MRISVYITSYNQKDFLKEAVDSVLAQTMRPHEILIVDDASTDGSRDLISSYAIKHPNLIRYHINDKNVGVTKTRNKALDLVEGDFVTYLDGDDKYLPEKLEIQARCIKESNADLVYGNFYFAENELTNLTGIWFRDRRKLPSSSNIFREVISRAFPQNTLFRFELVRKEYLDQIGRYDEELTIYEDFEFRIRLTKDAHTAFSIEPIAVYRKHSSGLSNTDISKHIDSLNYIFKKHESAIGTLAIDDQQFVRRRIEKIMNELRSPVKNESTIKRRFKNWLIRQIKKL